MVDMDDTVDISSRVSSNALLNLLASVSGLELNAEIPKTIEFFIGL